MARESGLTTNSGNEEDTNCDRAGPELQTHRREVSRCTRLPGRRAPTTAHPVAKAQPTGLGEGGPLTPTSVTVHGAEPQPLSGPGICLNLQRRDWSPSCHTQERKEVVMGDKGGRAEETNRD